MRTDTYEDFAQWRALRPKATVGDATREFTATPLDTLVTWFSRFRDETGAAISAREPGMLAIEPGGIDQREAGHTAPPVLRMPLAGVPSHCPHCGTAAAFPLTVYGSQVGASCPACFRIVAPVAVTSETDRLPREKWGDVQDVLADWLDGRRAGAEE